MTKMEQRKQTYLYKVLPALWHQKDGTRPYVVVRASTTLEARVQGRKLLRDLGLQVDGFDPMLVIHPQQGAKEGDSNLLD